MAKKKSLEQMLADMAAAAEEAAKEADKLSDPLLQSINERADKLRGIFDDLKLKDPETYEQLKKIVNSETRKNVAIANIAERVRKLGKAGKKAAESISKLTGAGALAAVGEALGKRK